MEAFGLTLSLMVAENTWSDSVWVCMYAQCCLELNAYQSMQETKYLTLGVCKSHVQV